MIKLKGAPAEELNGFLDQDTEFEGQLRFKDTFRIDGRAKGRIVSEKLLIVGEEGVVEADIDCGIVSIRGRVTGTVRGRERIELLSGCQVQGTLVSPRVMMEEGAFFQGDCRMEEPPAAPASARERNGERNGRSQKTR